MDPVFRDSKQPIETWPMTKDFSGTGKLPPATAIVSGTVSAARLERERLSTTLAASAAVAAATISLTANVLGGAIVILKPGSTTEEKRRVLSLSGSGPYIGTLDIPLDYAHSSAEVVTYSPGATVEVLVSPTATITGGTKATFRRKRGIGGKAYQVTLDVTLDDGSVLQEDMLMEVEEQ